MEYEKICCAVDLSAAAELVVRRAAELAARHDAVLTLVHVDAGAAAAAPALDAPRATRLDALRDVAEGALDRIVFVAVLAGDPAEEIVRYAARHAVDLLVLGTHGHSGATRLVLGSVAEAVVRRAPCPVLVVRPKVVEQVPEARLVEEYGAF